jgi:opacity protein-like surface antigen
MRYFAVIAFCWLTTFWSHAQPLNIKKNQGGLFSLGVRSTSSFFGDVNSFGFGGQMRLQFADRLNTEWFADFTRGNIQHRANRSDYHIGWSVMYYFTKKLAPAVKPYILAGHCFDRTVIVDNSNRSHQIVKNSSAIQAGAGVHFNLTERLDITLIAQYMFHLGKDVHAHIHDDGELDLSLTKGTGIEGHLLLNVGINYKIADLWYGGKKKEKK